MGIAISSVKLCVRIDNIILIHSLNGLLYDHCLHFKSTHVAIINHHCKSVLQDFCVEELIETCRSLGAVLQNDNECVHAVQTNFHELWLLMLHGEYDCKYNAFESLGVQVKEPHSAMLDYVHYQSEESFSEFGERNKVILNLSQGTSTKCLKDSW